MNHDTGSRVKYIALASLLAWAFSLPAVSHAVVPADAYDYLNALRGDAGMIPLMRNDVLEQAAQNHADYLSTHNLSGHYQRSGDEGFTGVRPADRAVHAGYSSLKVAENATSGQRDAFDSLDGLFSAIYHRTIFLDFSIDEIGMGAAPYDSGYLAHVYDIGKSGLEHLCRGLPFNGYGSYYFGVCDPDIRIETGVYDNAITRVRTRNPGVVLWPAAGAVDIPPAFFEEQPDPLPDFSVSGYPISVHFNEGDIESIDAVSLRLYRTDDGSEVLPVRLMTSETDPNQRLDPLTFALFPLERLDWNTTYQVEGSALVDGERMALDWSFTTRDPGVPVNAISGDGEEIEATNGAAFAVYVKPMDGDDRLTNVSYRYSSNIEVELEFIDQNTLLVVLRGDVGGRADFTLGEDRTFGVDIVDDIVLSDSLLDIDGNGKNDALTDGLLLIRYLFGLSGDALVSGAVGAGCTRCDNVSLAEIALSRTAQLDVDGNGVTDALTDGLLIMRYLFGFKGNTLIQGVVAADCSRCIAAEIEAYCKSLTP